MTNKLSHEDCISNGVSMPGVRVVWKLDGRACGPSFDPYHLHVCANRICPRTDGSVACHENSVKGARDFVGMVRTIHSNLYAWLEINTSE